MFKVISTDNSLDKESVNRLIETLQKDPAYPTKKEFFLKGGTYLYFRDNRLEVTGGAVLKPFKANPKYWQVSQVFFHMDETSPHIELAENFRFAGESFYQQLHVFLSNYSLIKGIERIFISVSAEEFQNIGTYSFWTIGAPYHVSEDLVCAECQLGSALGYDEVHVA
ncbi:MAG: hypothetical protein ACPGXY_02235 [Alphaproteobacteria bacterium]